MFSLFSKKKAEGQPVEAPKEKLSRPKDLHHAVGRYLVVSAGQNPDWVWNLKNVLRPSTAGPKKMDFRVFNPRDAAAKRVPIKNWHSLDDHPELILYHGWLDNRTGDVEVISDQGATKVSA